MSPSQGLYVHKAAHIYTPGIVFEWAKTVCSHCDLLPNR